METEPADAQVPRHTLTAIEIFRIFRIEASHSLPALPQGHPCRRVHGHSWRVELGVEGPVEKERGWVVDFAELEGAFGPLLAQLDHAHLNELEGLGHPTSENLALWIWGRLKPALPALSRITVWETETAGCTYRGEGETG